MKQDSLIFLIEHNTVKPKTDLEKQEEFNQWMANVVKSKGYSDNEQMTNAYERVL